MIKTKQEKELLNNIEYEAFKTRGLPFGVLFAGVYDKVNETVNPQIHKGKFRIAIGKILSRY